MLATTFGTGELLRAVLDAGVRRITLGIGGSATTDGGCGILVALGAVMRDAEGELVTELPTPPVPILMHAIASIDLSDLREARAGQSADRMRCD